MDLDVHCALSALLSPYDHIISNSNVIGGLWSDVFVLKWILTLFIPRVFRINLTLPFSFEARGVNFTAICLYDISHYSELNVL